MPKVEAADHRHRERPIPIPRPRFPTLQAEHHTYKFDRWGQSLSVSWSGGQQFLSSGDTRQLYGFLRRMYEPAARPSQPLRRTGRQSHSKEKRGEKQVSIQPTDTSTEAHQETGMEFEAYNGWGNYPSWSVFTVMTSYFATYRELEWIADQGKPEAVQQFVTGMVDTWKSGRPTPHEETARMQVQDFLMSGIRKVEWAAVYDTLRGEKPELGEANRLTTLAYQLLSQTDWQALVKEAEYLTQADDLLRDWLEDQCLTWIESAEARQYTGIVGKFANTVLDLYFSVVQWDKVTKALRGDEE